MALSDDEKKTLDALMAKQNEPDDSDFDIEIWDDTGAGARVPYSKGRKWLADKFGIDVPAVADPEPKTKTKTGTTDSTDNGPVPIRYFGSQRQGKTGS